MGKLGSFDFDYDQMIRDVKGAKTTEDFADINTKYGTDLVEDETVYSADGGRIGYAGGEMVEGMAEGVEKVGRGGSEIIEKIKEGIMEGGRRGMGAPFIDEAIWIEKIKDFIRKKRGERDRRGYALGSKADFAIEDVMTGGMEDEIGGITGIMRQADLQRKGNVGQFYAAEGGSPSAVEREIEFWKSQGMSDEEALEAIIQRKPRGKEIREPFYPDRFEGKEIREPFYPHKFPDLKPQPMAEGGIMDLGGMEKDYRETGGFVDLGAEEKADDVPARLSVNEFVMTADAVRGAGDGDIDKGASIMENMMKELEGKGQQFAGGGERGWKAQMRAMEIAEEEYGRDFYDLNDALQHKIYNRALQEIDDMLMGRQGASDMFEVSERLSEVV